MELAPALEFVRNHRNGVLVTLKRDGRPQLSNIIYSVRDDGEIRISITADRAKYVNLQRDPRASLYVTRDDFWAYVVIEGDAVTSPVAADVNDATVEELIDVYRSFGNEHPNWDEYRESMVADRRTVLHIKPTHAYGMLGG